MIDIIIGAVLVVLARFLATAVVTLRCNRLSDMFAPAFLVLYLMDCSTSRLDPQTIVKTADSPVLVIVVVTDFHVFQDAHGVVRQHRTGEVRRQ